MPYIDFAELKNSVSIEAVAELLSLPLTKAGAQFRCECPVHGGGPRSMVLTPGRNLFFCFGEKKGGDQLDLYAHVQEMTVKDAVAEIAAQLGTVPVPDRDTSSPVPVPRKNEAKPAPTFDPEKFAAKLVWSPEVQALGLSQDEAASLGIGWHPARKSVFFPVRHANGELSAFIGCDANQKLKLPPQYLPSQSNVVKLPKRA